MKLNLQKIGDTIWFKLRLHSGLIFAVAMWSIAWWAQIFTTFHNTALGFVFGFFTFVGAMAVEARTTPE